MYLLTNHFKNSWKCILHFLFADATDQSDQSGIAKSVPIGSKVELECRSTLSPPVSYSWTKVQQQVSNGATLRGSTLILPNVQAEHAGFYICKANNRWEKGLKNVGFVHNLVIT